MTCVSAIVALGAVCAACGGQLPAVSSEPSAFGSQLSAVSSRPSAVSARLSAISVQSRPAAGAAVAQRGTGEQLLREPALAAAVARIREDEPQVLDEQRQLCEVPAPPFGEAARAAVLRARFEALGLTGVRIDAAGNVLGERRGLAAHPHLVLAAHLDTVFPEGTPVKTTRAGAVLRGPGIADDCRGLAVMLAVIRALDAVRVQIGGTITFAGTVGEEGLGDLRGVKHLFEERRGEVDAFVSVDGAGMGITRTAVGSLRYRVTFSGTGGHSYGDFGIANPMHAMGRAMARIADLPVPRTPRTTFNVGRIGGGTSVNAIASSVWMEVDLRSSEPAALGRLDAAFAGALAAAVADENRRGSAGPGVAVETQAVGNRPGGSTAAGAAIVTAAVSITTALGGSAVPGEGSTDANIPISLGVPAITIGGGGSAEGTHTSTEAFDSTDSWRGTARALLLTVALAR